MDDRLAEDDLRAIHHERRLEHGIIERAAECVACIVEEIIVQPEAHCVDDVILYGVIADNEAIHRCHGARTREGFLVAPHELIACAIDVGELGKLSV